MCGGKHDPYLFNRGGGNWSLCQTLFLWHTISVQEPRRGKERKPTKGSRATFSLRLVHLRKDVDLRKTKNRTTTIQTLMVMTTVIRRCTCLHSELPTLAALYSVWCRSS